MEKIPVIINGGSHTDHRGTIRFLNDFDMSEIKRFYIIEHPDAATIRGWRAHRIEQRWFYVIEGEFLIQFVKIDDWKSPSRESPIKEFRLSGDQHRVLHVPAGYGTCLQAIHNNSKMLVFADYGVDHSSHDDYLYPTDYFAIDKSKNEA